MSVPKMANIVSLTSEKTAIILNFMDFRAQYVGCDYDPFFIAFAAAFAFGSSQELPFQPAGKEG